MQCLDFFSVCLMLICVYFCEHVLIIEHHFFIFGLDFIDGTLLVGY